MSRSYLPLVPVAATVSGLLLVASESVERGGGGFTPASYVLTIAAFLGVGLTSWVLHLGQAPPAGRGGLVGLLTFGLGFLLAGIADWIGFGAPDEAALQQQVGPLVLSGGVLIVVGGAVFGASALRARVYPPWTALTVALAPLALPLTSVGLPVAAVSITNAALGVALAVMGVQARRSARDRSRGGTVRTS